MAISFPTTELSPYDIELMLIPGSSDAASQVTRACLKRLRPSFPNQSINFSPTPKRRITQEKGEENTFAKMLYPDPRRLFEIHCCFPPTYQNTPFAAGHSKVDVQAVQNFCDSASSQYLYPNSMQTHIPVFHLKLPGPISDLQRQRAKTLDTFTTALGNLPEPILLADLEGLRELRDENGNPIAFLFFYQKDFARCLIHLMGFPQPKIVERAYAGETKEAIISTSVALAGWWKKYAEHIVSAITLPSYNICNAYASRREYKCAIQTLLGSNIFVALNYLRYSSINFILQNMHFFQEQGYTTLYLEWPKQLQAQMIKYLENPKETMPTELALLARKSGMWVLFECAKMHHMRIVFIGNMLAGTQPASPACSTLMLAEIERDAINRLEGNFLALVSTMQAGKLASMIWNCKSVMIFDNAPESTATLFTIVSHDQKSKIVLREKIATIVERYRSDLYICGPSTDMSVDENENLKPVFMRNPMTDYDNPLCIEFSCEK